MISLKSKPIKLKGVCIAVCALDKNKKYTVNFLVNESDDILKMLLDNNIDPNYDYEANGIKRSDLIDEYTKQHNDAMTIDVGVVYEGIEFIEDILSEGISDDDGILDCIIINGYKSNLGLFMSEKFNQGKFKVDEEVFRKICSEHDVKVVWCNK